MTIWLLSPIMFYPYTDCFIIFYKKPIVNKNEDFFYFLHKKSGVPFRYYRFLLLKTMLYKGISKKVLFV